jgi:hypothetical protein
MVDSGMRLIAHFDSANVAGRGETAVASFAQSRVDVILSGHLHGSASEAEESSAEDSSVRYGKTRRLVLLVPADTATSTRRRKEVNFFNLL